MIQLRYGSKQKFRFHHNDINILGKVEAALPLKSSNYRLNDGEFVHFYVEPIPSRRGPRYAWGTKTPSVHRLREQPGKFNIEIPINTPHLHKGWNNLTICIEDEKGQVKTLDMSFHWDSNPLPLPLNLTNLNQYESIQDIGQIVNGAFEIDRQRNAICTKEPVGSDILFLIGSPYGSQEATYDVKFTHSLKDWCFLGLSDFFFGHQEQSPDLGIKPGYCTAGLATINNKGYGQVWLAWGDCLTNKENTWVITTEKKPKFPVKPGITYSVRHQAIITEKFNFARFRIWRKGRPEPKRWLCQEHNSNLNPNFPRLGTASFGLFQYWGMPTEWSNITVKPLDVNTQELKLPKERSNLSVLVQTIREYIEHF